MRIEQGIIGLKDSGVLVCHGWMAKANEDVRTQGRVVDHTSLCMDDRSGEEFCDVIFSRVRQEVNKRWENVREIISPIVLLHREAENG